MLCARVSIVAIIESSALTGISFLISQDPLGNAPVYITITNNAVANAPLENIGGDQGLDFFCVHVGVPL